MDAGTDWHRARDAAQRPVAHKNSRADGYNPRGSGRGSQTAQRNAAKGMGMLTGLIVLMLVTVMSIMLDL